MIWDNFFYLLGLSDGNARGINSAPFFFFFAFSHKTQFNYSACVKCARMRRMNTREHGLKQRPPSWKIPRLMKAKEIRWLLRSMYIQSHTPFAVDPHLNLWSVLGTGRSSNFTKDQFTSDPLRVNLLSRNIKRNQLYQTSYLILFSSY